MFNIYLGIFIVVAIATIAGGTYKLYDMKLTYGAFIFFAGSLAAFIIYGLRWFGDKGAFSQTPVSWPPTVNTCPDYLTHYKRKKADGTFQHTCIDLIGVSKTGILQVFPSDPEAPPPASDQYYFSLETKSSDPVLKKGELCNNAMIAGLTWEGITNGEACIAPDGTPAGADKNATPSSCAVTAPTAPAPK